MTQQVHDPDGRPSEMQPHSSRPVQPVSVSYGSVWLHYIMVIGLLVAWWFPVKIVVSRWLWPPATYSGPREAESFVTLAYEGVSSKTNEISPAQFNEHLEVLKAHGYNPIRLDDVRRLFKEGRKLPPKAVLLTFDHARKTSYYSVNPILRRMGWTAVMFLWTESIVEKDPASLLWPYVQIMARSKLWEIGAQSYGGFEKIKASPGGRMGHFMTSPRWLDKDLRYETVEEFQKRLIADHEKCLTDIEEEVSLKPMAFAYPYGDFGQFQPRAVVPRSINLALVGKNYDLGFLSGNLALNTRYSDPRRLNRLRVRSSWSASDLIRYLDRSWPLEEAQLEKDTVTMPSAWIVDWGAMKQEDNRLTLYAPEELTGAKIWLGGSDLSRDFYTRVLFKLERGQMGVYLRAAADEESYVYLGMDTRGEVWLREKKMGQEMDNWSDDELSNDLNVWLRQKSVSAERFTLASARLGLDSRDDHILEIFVRDRMLFAMLDGRQIFKDHILLRGEARPGMLGISVWDPVKGQARVSISSVVLNSEQRTLAAWDIDRAREPYVLQWLHRNAYRLTGLSPKWMTVSGVGQALKTGWDATTFKTLSRIYHLKLMPCVRVENEQALSRLTPSKLADDAAADQCDGIFMDFGDMNNPSPAGITTWLMQCAKTLQRKGLSMLVRLPTAIESSMSLRSILAVAPGLQLAVSTNSPIKRDPYTKESTTKVETIPSPAPDEGLPLSFEIPMTAGTNMEETLEASLSRLQQEGQAAYLDAEYDKAVEAWSEWFKLDAMNPRPPMLIGDAYLRKGDSEQAILFYDRSLEQDPGQISLVIRRVNLLTKMGRINEAVSSLNMYARLFPDDVSILLAQAEWLWRQNRNPEAIRLVERILTLEPEHIEANAIALRLPLEPAEFTARLDTLVKLGQKADKRYELGQAIWKYDLLSVAQTYPLIRLINTVSEQKGDDRVTALFLRLKPRYAPLQESCADGHLSEAWWLDGGSFSRHSTQGGVLSADSSHSEAALRLLGSEHITDSFIEAVVKKVSGSFWLYVRRTSDHFIRFGLDDTHQLFLQVWNHGHLVASQSKFWTLPADGANLRLALRGDGVIGLIDSSPVFSSPLEVPPHLGLGWVGLSVYRNERGTAQAAISRIAAGPLMPRLVLLPALKATNDVDVLIEKLQPECNYISDLAPLWFRIEENGTWSKSAGENEMLLRLFARYYRLRLMPAVQASSAHQISGSELLAAADKHGFSGFTLLLDRLPEAAWFEKLDRELAGSSLKVLVLALDPVAGACQWRGAGEGAAIFNGASEVRDVQAVSWEEPNGSHKPLSTLSPTKPVVVAMPDALPGIPLWTGMEASTVDSKK
ncbi:MAG: hypothetical protein A2X46_06575 [Lentisphaerae bacterium GWF2_57_35]|nr:MAG: hypothetical protein A2X46_06575 [Lentisphaerae bacterium GWF2_57_35]